MQPLGKAPPGHRPASEFINDQQLCAAHHIMGIALKHLVRAQGLRQMMQQSHIDHIIK